MKKNMIKWVVTGVATALLCACADSGSSSTMGVQISSQSATSYPPVSMNACRVSSHPPLGTYVVIAQLKATARPNETSTHVLQRLQAQGAAVGSTYVMVTSVTDKTFITPQNSEVADNPYLSQENSFFDTASPYDLAYNHELNNGTQQSTRAVITAEALKITSGSNKPNKALPSNVWQERTN